MIKAVSAVVVAAAVVSVSADDLVVDSDNSPLTLSSAEATTTHYDSAVVNGVLNVNENVTVYLDDQPGYFDIGTEAGVDAVVNFTGDPKTTRFQHKNASSSRFNIRIGAASNGGSGKIVATGTEQSVPLTATYMNNIYGGSGYGHLTYRHQNLTVLAGAAANGKLTGASAANDVVDALVLNKGGMAGISSMFNKSPFPARVLFNGGAITYNNCWEGEGFAADTATKWILESVDGNPIVLYTIYGPRTLNKKGCTLETRGTGDMILGGNGNTANHNIYSVYAGMQWNHSGDVVIGDNSRLMMYSANVSPCGAGRGRVVIKTDLQPNNAALSAYYNPNGYGQHLNSLEITGKGGWVTNSSATVATLTFGTNDLNGTFRAPRIGGKIALAKMGTGTLTVTNTPAVPALDVKAGQVDVCRADAGQVTMDPVTLSATAKLTIKTATTVKAFTVKAAGAELIVDGVRLTVMQALPHLLTVTLRNGGTIDYAFAPGAGETDRLRSATDAASANDVVMTGAGTLQLDAAGGYFRSVAVEAGTVKLGLFGTDNRFWRATYKQAMTAGQTLYLCPLRLFDADHAYADGGSPSSLSTYQTYADKTGTITDPSELSAKQFICSTTDYQAPGGSGGDVYVGPYAQFFCSTVYTCHFNVAPTNDIPDSWITMTWRIPDAGTVGYPSSYDLKCQWAGSNSHCPGAWKLESSPTGLDGSWVTMDEKSGLKGSWGQSWYNGQNSDTAGSPNPWQLPTAIRASDTPLASVGTLSVASGATFDATLVTGGQEIDDLTVDAAAGGGTLVNVKFAPTGVLRLTNVAAKLSGTYRVPLTFTDAGATANLSDWTVTVNGSPIKSRLGWVDGGIVVLARGMMIIVK